MVTHCQNHVYVIILLIFVIILGLNIFLQLSKTINKTSKTSRIDNRTNIIESKYKKDILSILQSLNSIKNNQNTNQKSIEDVYYNSFNPPSRLYNSTDPIFNIRTRGERQDFQLYGVLMNDKTAYNLFGRRTYRNSNIYEYYIIGNINNTEIKIPLKYNKEFNNEQNIKLPELNNENFKVLLYEINSFRN